MMKAVIRGVVVYAIILAAVALFAGVITHWQRCQAHAHPVSVDGLTYCFDNGDFNVDGE